MWCGAIILCAIFFIPIWQVTLSAPQYPDPIGMNIWIYKISDMNPNDLKNMNIMNHYIGMDEIPEYIPEFKYIPYILGSMIILGIVISFKRNYYFYLLWFIAMCCLGIIGAYDFWLWEYNYGHNLDPNAAIKFFDDMGNPLSYQPPLIGSKKVLNFVATSIPLLGFYLILLSMFLSLAAFLIEKKENKKSRIKFNKLKLGIVTMICCCFYSCQVNPKEISYGFHECNECKMRIVDNKHGSEIVTKKGKVLFFDSIECMLNNLKQFHENDLKFILTNVYDEPSVLYNANNSTYIISDALKSPMGMNLTAFLSKQAATDYIKKNGGEMYSWDEINSKFLN